MSALSSGPSTVPGTDIDRRIDHRERRIWEMVAASPLHNLWNLQGASLKTVAMRTWKSLMADQIFNRSAELGFYFLFALFPTLLCASSILGLAARSAFKIYDRLLDYLALVLPTSALGTVLNTFNETTAASTSGKITFGLVAAIWSASVGISAVQGTLNAVYKLEDRRSYIRARISAIVLIGTISLCLASMFSGDFAAAWAHHRIPDHALSETVAMAAKLSGWFLASAFLALSFSLTYYWAPDLRSRCWCWLTPGSTIGMVGWLLSSIGFRIYLHYFNTYSVTYGSLGAVIILLMWFYITGLMLLLGAEINSEIAAAAAAAKLERESTHSLADAEKHAA